MDNFNKHIIRYFLVVLPMGSNLTLTGNHLLKVKTMVPTLGCAENLVTLSSR